MQISSPHGIRGVVCKEADPFLRRHPHFPHYIRGLIYQLLVPGAESQRFLQQRKDILLFIKVGVTGNGQIPVRNIELRFQVNAF